MELCRQQRGRVAHNGRVLRKFYPGPKRRRSLGHTSSSHFAKRSAPQDVSAIASCSSTFSGNSRVGHLLLVSGKTGEELRKVSLPNGTETFYTPQIFSPNNNGSYTVLFGTGGPTTPGNLSVVDLSDLLLHAENMVSRERLRNDSSSFCHLLDHNNSVRRTLQRSHVAVRPDRHNGRRVSGHSHIRDQFHNCGSGRKNPQANLELHRRQLGKLRHSHSGLLQLRQRDGFSRALPGRTRISNLLLFAGLLKHIRFKLPLATLPIPFRPL